MRHQAYVTAPEVESRIVDPRFLARLQAFDPNLVCVWNKRRECWVIFERALDGIGTYGTGWNFLLAAIDEDGRPRPLGDWVLNTLYVWRQRGEARARNPEQYALDEINLMEENKRKREEAMSSEHQAQLKDEILEWRRAANEIANEPRADIGFHAVKKSDALHTALTKKEKVS